MGETLDPSVAWSLKRVRRSQGRKAAASGGAAGAAVVAAPGPACPDGGIPACPLPGSSWGFRRRRGLPGICGNRGAGEFLSASDCYPCLAGGWGGPSPARAGGGDTRSLSVGPGADLLSFTGPASAEKAQKPLEGQLAKILEPPFPRETLCGLGATWTWRGCQRGRAPTLLCARCRARAAAGIRAGVFPGSCGPSALLGTSGRSQCWQRVALCTRYKPFSQIRLR